jgi:hypothetical protein
MPHFDLHCHPTSKVTMMELDIAQCKDPFELLDFSINPSKLNGLASILGSIITGIAGRQALERIFGDPLDSQSSLNQVEGGSLVTIVLISIERAYTEIKLLETINELNDTLFTKIKNRDTDNETSYHQSLVNRELAYLNLHNGKTVNGRKFKLINTIRDYPNQPDPNTVYGVVSVEGGHNFYTFPNQKEQEKKEQGQFVNIHTAIDALTAWKQSTTRPRLLYTTGYTSRPKRPLESSVGYSRQLFKSG